MKKHRFFYHYRRTTGGMTVHYKGQCIPCMDVVCKAETETHRNKTQPRLVIRGYASAIVKHGDTVVIFQ